MTKVLSVTFQDTYNPLKTWQVCFLKGGFYLFQYIKGVKQGKGLRTTKKYLKSLGILDMKKFKSQYPLKCSHLRSKAF